MPGTPPSHAALLKRLRDMQAALPSYRGDLVGGERELHLALISYRLPDTGEIVPMLQIVPSKNNHERLLLISPELANVLATILTRLRAHNNGAVALTARYDWHERTSSPPLPHLFQRQVAWVGKSSTPPRSAR